MRNSISIGQYYPTNSLIHRLDPRVKLLYTIVFVTMVFFIHSFWGYAFTILCLSCVVHLSNVPPKFMFRGLRSILMILLFTTVLNIFFTTGNTVLFSWGFVTVSQEGLLIAIAMAIRLVILIVGSSVLTLTTPPIALTDAMEYGLKPFKKIGVPSHEIAMMMSIALRFIPTMIEEMDKIMKAQMARGADFETGGILKKGKSLVPILVPLFISSFRRADELAEAMEARCYRGDIGRTKMKQMQLLKTDKQALFVLLGFVVCVFAIGFVGAN